MGNDYATSTGMHHGTPGVFTKAAGAETVSTTHGLVDGSHSASAIVTVNVTASGGTTPTLTVAVEGSNDGTNWVLLGTLGANGYNLGSVATAPSNLTGAATVTGVFPTMGSVRTRSIVGGTTPTFTYSVLVGLGG